MPSSQLSDKQTLDLVLVHETINQMNSRMEKSNDRFDKRLESQSNDMRELAITAAETNVILRTFAEKQEGRLDSLSDNVNSTINQIQTINEWRIRVNMIWIIIAGLSSVLATLLIPAIRTFIFGA